MTFTENCPITMVALVDLSLCKAKLLILSAQIKEL